MSNDAKNRIIMKERREWLCGNKEHVATDVITGKSFAAGGKNGRQIAYKKCSDSIKKESKKS